MNATDTIKQLQVLLHVAEDGSIGPKTMAAMLLLQKQDAGAPWPPVAAVVPDASGVHSVEASSFADPADVAAFRKCKSHGLSDVTCFAVGDNGIGKWGDDCTADKPMCALPPEYWAQFGAAARGKQVVVTANGHMVTCELRDTMPHEANIHNGAGIDLNPGAVALLGLTAPIMTPATWRWA